MDYSGAINNNNESLITTTDLADQLTTSIDDDLNCVNDHYTSTMNRLNRMYIESRLTDVTLVCGTNNEIKTIKAHRVVLSSVSDYFYAMFNNDLLESRKTEIVINDVEPVALSSLIDYIYSGSIELNESNIYAILSAANMLQLDKIVKLGCNYLLKNLSISNCISTFRFSEKYLFNQLNEISKQYILDNFTSLIYTFEFNELSYQEIELFLSNNDLNINNEEFAFEALIKWINNDLTSRLCYLSKLLSFIKLPLLNPLYLTQQIESNKLIKSSTECQNLLLEAMTYHVLKSHQQQTNNFNPRTIPRRSTVGCLLAIGGIVNTNEACKGQAIEKYDCRLDKWSIHNYMNSRRLQCGVVLIDNRLYIVGGREGLKTLSSVEYYDFEKQVWSSVNSMNTHRHGLGACYFNSLLYAIGGHDGWSFLNTCERYELETSTWTIVSPMLSARSTLGVTSLNNRLYAIGGRDSSSCLKLVEYYNPNNNKWIQCTSMIKRRGSVGVTVLNDYIYAVGGHELPNTLLGCNRWDCAERYDAKLDQWTLIPSMSKPKEAVGVSSLGNYLYVVGGFDGNKYLNDVERYDPNKNEWKRVQCLNMLRAGTSLIHVKNEVLNKEHCKSPITQIVDDTSSFKNIKYNFLNEINKTNSSNSSASSTPSLSKSLSCDYGASVNYANNNNSLLVDDNVDESSFFYTI